MQVVSPASSQAAGSGRAGASASGRSEDVIGLRPGGRRRSLGMAALGGLFVLIAALLGASYFSSLRSSQAVLVAGSNLAAGDIVAADALQVVELGADGLGQLSFVPADRQDEVVGLTALGPVPAGSLLSVAMFGERADVIPDGRSVVGVVLDRGALPAGVVHAGDDVELIAVADASTLVDEPRVAEVLGRAQVWVVEPAPELERGTSLSVVVESGLAPEVAQAAADGRLRIGLVGR